MEFSSRKSEIGFFFSVMAVMRTAFAVCSVSRSGIPRF